MNQRNARLRELLKAGGPGIVPGATDCFTAKLIEAAVCRCHASAPAATAGSMALSGRSRFVGLIT